LRRRVARSRKTKLSHAVSRRTWEVEAGSHGWPHGPLTYICAASLCKRQDSPARASLPAVVDSRFCSATRPKGDRSESVARRLGAPRDGRAATLSTIRGASLIALDCPRRRIQGGAVRTWAGAIGGAFRLCETGAAGPGRGRPTTGPPSPNTLVIVPLAAAAQRPERSGWPRLSLGGMGFIPDVCPLPGLQPNFSTLHYPF
jgi:hypothetical protein